MSSTLVPRPSIAQLAHLIKEAVEECEVQREGVVLPITTDSLLSVLNYLGCAFMMADWEEVDKLAWQISSNAVDSSIASAAAAAIEPRGPRDHAQSARGGQRRQRNPRIGSTRGAPKHYRTGRKPIGAGATFDSIKRQLRRANEKVASLKKLVKQLQLEIREKEAGLMVMRKRRKTVKSCMGRLSTPGGYKAAIKACQGYAGCEVLTAILDLKVGRQAIVAWVNRLSVALTIITEEWYAAHYFHQERMRNAAILADATRDEVDGRVDGRAPRRILLLSSEIHIIEGVVVRYQYVTHFFCKSAPLFLGRDVQLRPAPEVFEI